MKVKLHYEDNKTEAFHKSLKITLPKSWKSGPTSRLLSQFVESYNQTFISSNELNASDLHLMIRKDNECIPLASDAVVIDTIPDRADVYIVHGPSQTILEMKEEEHKIQEEKRLERERTVCCTNFGCNKRFPRGGPYPECRYHLKPPVFHETAKFWSCCPNKKAYDWDDFQKIPGCCVGMCTDKKDDEKQKLFLGGCDLREQATGKTNLKSIDNFNAEEKKQSTPSEDLPSESLLKSLKEVLHDVDIDHELFDQIANGIQSDNPDIVAKEIGKKIKEAFKVIAMEQLRIK